MSAALLPAQAADTGTAGPHALLNKGLVGVGRMPADLRDKFGETVGSGSGLAVDPASWTRAADGYRGTFYMLPDRGYNVAGSTDFRARLYKLSIVFKPAGTPAALPAAQRRSSVAATLDDTILLTDAAGQSLTGLDPAEGGIRRAANGLPAMPQASSGRVSLDSEAVVLMPDGSFFISDEYGPYIYRFSAAGRMLSAIRPPDAFIPRRNGKDHFSSNNPGPGASAPKPENPDSGRQNNQGFEGLALTPDGKFLVAILQSATRQDGGNAPETRQHTRILYYDIADVQRPKLVREHVVALPVFKDAQGRTRVAAQSELLALDESRFLLLCRDSNNGYGTEGATSRYRKIEVLDTSAASNIANTKYDENIAVAPGGKLEDGIVPATLTTFIDINDNSQLNPFGLHNGEPNDRDNLGEKWEGMALVPALDPAGPDDFFLFVTNDNDFITQNGFQVGAPYKDPSGADVDTIILVYRVTLPDPGR
ncbi:MAG: hypothetical protein QOI12_3301 [Alphaproteobacteria bacterium]|nr:hypothetical protein [Alphaproteobacteria bacterium]